MALLDVLEVAEHDGADRLLVEVEGQSQRAALELDQLVDRALGKAGDAGDAVAHLDDPPDLLLGQRRGEALEVLAQDGGDVVGLDRELGHLGYICSFNWSNR